MKIIPLYILNLKKAYTEGIYQDSSLNRKLGRVGMSYKEYEKIIGGYGKSEKIKKERNNEVPIYLSDLNFNKDNKANYQLKDGTNIEVSLISHEKYGDKNFTLKVGDKEYKNLNTTSLLRRLKALKDGTFNQSFQDGLISDKIPLTEEEFDDLYGDIGFNYTYYKDNLDIKVWIREDSDKKNPTFNIYVKDTKSGKTKSFTKLSLIQTHNKLLEYDLNPNVEKPLSIQQLKELKRIQKEQGYSLEETNEEGVDKDINKYFKNGKLISGEYSLNGLSFRVNLDLKKEYINIAIKNEQLPIQTKHIKVKNTKEAFSDFLKKVKKEGTKMDLSEEGDIKPSKDIGIKFNKYGNAFFTKNDKEIELSISPSNSSKINYIIFKENGVETIGTLNIDKINDWKDFKNKLGTQNVYRKYWDSNNLKIKDLVKDKKVDKEILYRLSQMTEGDRYEVTNEEREKLKAITARKGLNKTPTQKRDWNFDIREAYNFINSRAFINWIDDLPNPKNKTKREMYFEVKNLSQRFSSSGAYKGEFRDVNSISNVKRYLIDEYY